MTGLLGMIQRPAPGGNAQSHYSLDFAPASSQYVNVGSVSGMPSTAGPLTVFAWVYLRSWNVGSNSALIELKPASGSSFTFQLMTLDNSTFYLATDSQAWNMSTVAGNTPTLNAWHHVALTRDVGGLITYYLDGVSKVTLTPSYTGVAVTQVNIGARQYGATGYMDTLIDFAGVVATDLTGGQIASLAAGTLDPLTLSPAAFWSMEEGTGTTTADASGNGNGGTLVNGVTWNSSVPTQLQ